MLEIRASLIRDAVRREAPRKRPFHLPFGSGTTELVVGSRENRPGQQNLVYAMCRRGHHRELSAKMQNAFLRGLEGLADVYGQATLEHAAWQAGADQDRADRSSRR